MTPQQEEWLQALESDKYTKTINFLCTREHNGLCHCVLGVAADVFSERLGLEVREDTSRQVVSYGGWWCMTQLPPKIWHHLDLNNGIGVFSKPYCLYTDEGVQGMFESLSELNDKTNWSLKELAAFIRKNYDIVFRTNHYS